MLTDSTSKFGIGMAPSDGSTRASPFVSLFELIFSALAAVFVSETGAAGGGTGAEARAGAGDAGCFLADLTGFAAGGGSVTSSGAPASSATSEIGKSGAVISGASGGSGSEGCGAGGSAKARGFAAFAFFAPLGGATGAFSGVLRLRPRAGRSVALMGFPLGYGAGLACAAAMSNLFRP